jgi:hypothetical protein
MLRYDKIGFRKLRNALGRNGLSVSTTLPFAQFAALEISRRSSLIGKPLVDLLCHFADRECGLARDRIFSLAYLCSEKDAITIDYGVSVFRLIYQIMGSWKKSLCACLTVVIMRNLGPEIASLSAEELRYLAGAYLELDIIDLEVQLDRLDAFEDRCIPLQACCVLRRIFGLMFLDFRGHGLTGDLLTNGFSWRHNSHGTSTVGMSLWYLWDQDHASCAIGLCPRAKLGLSYGGHFCTSVHMGYGNWNVHAELLEKIASADLSDATRLKGGLH